MKPTIIAFSGVGCSGKTTMMNLLAEELSKKHIVLTGYRETENVLKKHNSRKELNVMFESSDDCTFMKCYYTLTRFMASDIEARMSANALNARFLIYDKSLYDFLAFCLISKNMDDSYKNFLKKMVTDHMVKFPLNFLFYLEPVAIVQNNAENVMKKRINLIADSKLMELYENVRVNIIKNSTVENRLKNIIEIISEINA